MAARAIDVVAMPGTQWPHDPTNFTDPLGEYHRVRWGRARSGPGVQPLGIDILLHKHRYDLSTDLQQVKPSPPGLKGQIGQIRLRRQARQGREFDHTHIIGYAPQEPAPGPGGDTRRKKCEQFCDTFHTWLQSVPIRSKLFLFIDANGHAGHITRNQDTTVLITKYPDTIGRAYREETNESGICLVEAANKAGLYLANTSSRGQCGPTHVNGHRLDYIGVEKDLEPNITACTTAPRLVKHLRITRNHGDHIPILLSIHLDPWPKQEKQQARRRLWNWLRVIHDRNDLRHQAQFIAEANKAIIAQKDHLDILSQTSLDQYWQTLMDILMPIATEHYGAPKNVTGRQKEWTSQQTQDLVDERGEHPSKLLGITEDTNITRQARYILTQTPHSDPLPQHVRKDINTHASRAGNTGQPGGS